jgi:two-component system, chemotaxis family, sensor kinase CheA
MDKGKLLQQLRASFVSELDERLSGINRDVLALEAAREAPPAETRALLASLTRAFHTLKGAARAASLPAAEQSCHELEDVLTAARDGRTAPGPPLLARLFATADALARLASSLRTGLPDPEGALPAPGAAGPPAIDGAALRVPPGKMDAVLSRSAELKDALAGLQPWLDELTWLDREGASGVSRLLAGVGSSKRRVERAAHELEQDLLRLRMVPLSDEMVVLERAARDLATSLGKEVDLTFEAGAAELDRAVLERLRGPLLHLVRNAVDHGIGPPDQRRAAGKPPRGRIDIRAALAGSEVAVSVADDGGGIDTAAVRRQAARKGVAVPDSDQETLRLVFAPGLSTSREVTDVSGRGVGLDVVRTEVESLHGRVEVWSAPGRGTRFTLTVPLTVSSLRALLVQAGGRTFALATSTVRRIQRARPDEIRGAAGRELLAQGGSLIPLLSLAAALELPGERAVAGNEPFLAVVVAAGERDAALVVDQVLEEAEIVTRGLGRRVRRAPGIAGVTVLAGDRLGLVLQAAELVRLAMDRGARPALRVKTAPAPRRRILVVDDSVTTRTLEKSILEAAGYEVLLASDGVEAWRVLQERGADLVVSDVEMPRMDGLSMAETIRGSKRFAGLPVILVTARGSDEDKARGVEVGADAYIVKSAFEEANLLETIAQLLP